MRKSYETFFSLYWGWIHVSTIVRSCPCPGNVPPTQTVFSVPLCTNNNEPQSVPSLCPRETHHSLDSIRQKRSTGYYHPQSHLSRLLYVFAIGVGLHPDPVASNLVSPLLWLWRVMTILNVWKEMPIIWPKDAGSIGVILSFLKESYLPTFMYRFK